MRLIDADAFDKMLIETQAECKKNGGNFRFGVLGNVRANLALFPTVDRPEIVRCKDCRYGQYCTDGEIVYQCFKWNSGEFGVLHEQDWFCADGER